MGTAVKQTVNEIREQLHDQLKERFGADDVYVYVDNFDPDDQWVVFEVQPNDGPSDLLRLSYTSDGTTVAVDQGEPDEVKRTVEYAPKGAELCGPIVRKDDAKRLVYGAVLVPGEADSDGEVLTAEKVEEVAHTWLSEFRAIDNQHSVKQIDAAPVESYIEPEDRTVEVGDDELTIPKGTWTMAAKIHDDDTWGEIVAGKRTGFSIMGVPRADLEAALGAVKSGDNTALKRVTLADVGGGDPNGDWVAPFVSVVDEPAVPKAKFYALKSQPTGDAGMLSRLKTWLAGEDGGPTAAGKAGRKISDKTYGQLQAAHEAIAALIAAAEQERNDNGASKAQKEDDMDREEIQTIVSESVPGALKEALGLEDDETIEDKIASAVKAAVDDTGDGDGSTEEEEDEDSLTTEEFMAEVLDRLDKVEKRTAAGSRQLPDDTDDGKAATKSRDRDAYGRRLQSA